MPRTKYSENARVFWNLSMAWNHRAEAADISVIDAMDKCRELIVDCYDYRHLKLTARVEALNHDLIKYGNKSRKEREVRKQGQIK